MSYMKIEFSIQNSEPRIIFFGTWVPRFVFAKATPDKTRDMRDYRHCMLGKKGFKLYTLNLVPETCFHVKINGWFL
jgi:hypothetical protein